ncbi:hypothetical protein [Streptomyces sp. NPDC088794]|uniref:hypothetical protein n=1 Tax=Streptomyces sp. NPDC088794 TaxID=3365902 RepID=UPI003830BDFA
MTVSALLLLVLAALIGVMAWRLVFSVRRLNAGQDPARRGPVLPDPTRQEPRRRDPGAGSGEPRRPMLTVASELAAIVGLLIAFIALLKN